jgi:small subunit ribosomal protein S18
VPRMRSKTRPARASARKKKDRSRPRRRFRDRGGKDWEGPLIDYKEVDLLRKMMTTSHKIMSRKRAGTNAAEQRDLKRAVKRARYMALLQYTGP